MRPISSLQYALIFTLISPVAQAAAGPSEKIRLETIQVNIDVKGDHKFSGSCDFKLKNAGGKAASLPVRAVSPAFTLKGGSAQRFGAGAARNLKADLSGTAGGHHLKRLVINPAITLNGKLPRHPVKRFTMDLTLPPNAKGLLKASLKPSSRRVLGQRIQYRWNYANFFPVPMVLLYHTASHQLAAAKRVKSRKGKVVEVEIEIKNEGKTEVKEIDVEEVLFLGDVKPAPGEGALVKVRARKGHGWLVLKRPIAALGPGQSRKICYKVMVKSRQASLKPTRVRVGKRLVALSNRLSLR